MRELAFAGLVAIAFGLGSFYATDHLGAFSLVNFALGGLALLTAFVRRAGQAPLAAGPAARRALLRGLAWIALALVAAVGLERGAAATGVVFDWTFERRFELAPGTRELLSELPEGTLALLYYTEGDPRIRRTRLLLEQMAAESPNLTVRKRRIEDHPDEEDLYEIGTSNTVVLRIGDRFETVERPTEGTLYEALHHLLTVEDATIVLLRGEGEGDPMTDGETDFSGLAVALQTEGYRLLSLPSAAVSEIPEEADAVLVIGPRRRLLDRSIEALRRFLERGGSLIALVEPGAETGVEALLAEYGMTSPDAVVLDPASGSLAGESAGVDVIAYNYERHPVTRGLDKNRMTFFRGVRPFELRKPTPDDEVERVVLSSPYAWLEEDLTVLRDGGESEPPPGAEQRYFTIAAAGRYARGDGEARILAIGDSDFASNRFLRSLYNLDLIVNGVHWSLARDARITLRPKVGGGVVQFPLPVSNSLQTLYGVGLLVPELLLVAGGIVWLRRRSA